ncbi:unnamed protein product [Mytilus coruscus]|uniref:Uncharacterized protein n=1 Tax=Mytilus coruscus TaxID=42192 RepID=A0A6J8BGD3_MYTCO|nr:unnamed protein product [Mytilus coruscus]
MQKGNAIQKMVTEEGLLTKRTIYKLVDASNVLDELADFPVLSMDKLREITMGVYQLKQAPNYVREHEGEDGKFELYVCKIKENLLKIKIQSRHSNKLSHTVFISYSDLRRYRRMRAIGAVDETRSLRDKVQLAEQAQRAARSMEQDYEEVVQLLEKEIAKLKQQLRFQGNVHEIMTGGSNVLSIRQQGEVARGNKPPAYLSKHKKLSPKTIAAEAKEVVCAVRSIIEAEHIEYTGTDKPSSEQLDWKECVICQVRTCDDLQCPADNKRTDIDIGAGYLSFDAIIQRCCALNWFPSTLNLEQLNEGHGIAQTLQNHKAKWHKSCRNKFSNLKISRQEKRKHMSEAEDSSNEQTSKITRHSCGESTRANN